jgi:diguanylate cyclase (GGDEF)-like protein
MESTEAADVETHVVDARQLDKVLLTIEDRFVWDVGPTLEVAAAVEQAALALGADEAVMRARLCQANMWGRQGDIAGAARRAWEVDTWAAEHGRPILRARAHLVLASVHRHLGDAATCLDHSIQAVEHLDDTATIHARVWHRAKLADALAEVGSMAAARNRFAQAEQLAATNDQHRLHMAVLNNYAYSEYCSGAHELAKRVVDRLQLMAATYDFELDPADFDTIGCIQIENGLFADAEHTLLACIELHAEGRHEDADALAEYLLTLARAQRGLGATDRAQVTLDASRALCVERDLGDVLVRVHQEQADLYAARGEFAQAFEQYKTFFAAYEELRSAQREAQARNRQAMFETAEARDDAERFREQARRDPLTGLHNRRYVDEQLPALVADQSNPVTIALLDLDHFKRINDQLSHDVGDKVLVIVARLLESGFGAARRGFVARMGGEEFLVVIPGGLYADAVRQLERIGGAIRSYAWAEITGDLPVTVSIGAASTHDGGGRTDRQELLSIADRNLYSAKHAGRDRVVSGLGEHPSRREFRDANPA